MTPARGWFYPVMAVATLATVFAGFAPTYYLRPSAAPALPLLTQVHGLVFTAWGLVLLAQVSLVAASRRDLHRRFGDLRRWWRAVSRTGRARRFTGD